MRNKRHHHRQATPVLSWRCTISAVLAVVLLVWAGLNLIFASDPNTFTTILSNGKQNIRGSTSLLTPGGGAVATVVSREAATVATGSAHTSTQPDTPPSKKKKVAYAVTVTRDGPFVDGALVLGYGARKVHDSKFGYPDDYDVDLVAFVVPSVVKARPILTAHGWRVLERKLPVELDEIENRVYAEKMRNSGCCGADEFLKLWAYTLTEYERVVHLDMDSIVFENMDELYRMDYELIHTHDYNMGTKPVPPVQGGFLVIRPSMDTFKEFQGIIRKGDYGAAGWGGTHVGKFWGGQTIQGILPYYYYKLHPGRGFEVNRCVYNCMVDNPYRPYKSETAKKICLNGEETCDDCRAQNAKDVKSAHFTICQKPWTCTLHNNPRNKDLCMELHAQWFQLRYEYEAALGINQAYAAQPTRFKASLGYCKGYGDNKYLPIPAV